MERSCRDLSNASIGMFVTFFLKRLFSHDAKLGVGDTIWLHAADCATLQLFNR